MMDFVDFVASSATPGLLIARVTVAAAALWLWERYERTKTNVLVQRERRARIRRGARHDGR
jgi:hypothetical protein